MTLVLQDQQTTDDGLKRVGVGDQTKLATSYVPTQSFLLVQVDIKVAQENGPVGNAHLEIRADDGSGLPGVLIATSVTAIDSSTLPNPADWVSFVFTPAVAVLIGVKIHFSLYGDGVAPGFGGGNAAWRVAQTIVGQDVSVLESGVWGVPGGSANTQADFKSYSDSGGSVVIPGKSIISNRFEDEFISVAKQTKGQKGGAAPVGASKLGKGKVNNYPFPDSEKEWDYANTLAMGTASPGIIPPANPQIPDPHQITNPLIIPEVDFIDYKSVRAKGQRGAITGLPRKNFTDINSMTAISMQSDIDGFQSMYGVRVSHPSQGTIPTPVSPSVIQGNGMVGAGTMRGD